MAERTPRITRVANDYSARLHHLSLQAEAGADRLCQQQLPENSDELAVMAANVDMAAQKLLAVATQALQLVGEMRGYAEATRVYDPNLGAE